MKSYVLYCPHLDRDIRGILSRVPDPEVITGYPTVPGEVGCLEMHKTAVRLAQHKGLPFVFVMEDDCKFTDAFVYSQWETMAAWALEHRFGAVHGGSVRTWNPRLLARLPGYEHIGEATTILQVDRACSAHCMIYTHLGYDAVLTAEQPFDLSIADKGVNPVLVWPFVAIQGKGLSGIGPPTHGGISTTYHGPQPVDYEGLFAMHEGSLRGLVA